ncbi:MAG: phage scaffolding protein [Candidatus Fimenecus sp.]
MTDLINTDKTIQDGSGTADSQDITTGADLSDESKTENAADSLKDNADITATDNEVQNLKAKCEELQKIIDEKDSQILLTEKNHKIEKVLNECKVQDLDLLKKLINFDDVIVVDGKLQGLDEQISILKKQYPYIFRLESTPAPKRSISILDLSDFVVEEEASKPWNR